MQGLGFLVQHGMVNLQRHLGRRRHKVHLQRHGVARHGDVLLRPQQYLDVVIVGDALVALLDDERLLDGLVRHYPDGTSDITGTYRHTVNGQNGTVGVAVLLHYQLVVTGIAGLAEVGELQRELRLLTCRHVGQLGAALHLQLGLLHAHRAFVQLRAFLIIILMIRGPGLRFVGIDRLSAYGAEDGSPLA